MNNQERIQEYINKECINCKHRDEELCEIRVIKCQDCIKTKCVYYEKEKELEGYKKQEYRTAKHQKPIMNGFHQEY